MSAQIQLRRDTSANWSAANPVLAEGEIGMDMTVNAFKVGDGAAAWNDIEYAGTDITLDDYYTKVEADDAFQPKGDYLTEFVEEDPTVPDHVKGITQDDIDGWNAGGGSGGSSLWEQNGDDIYYSDGAVGVGTDDPSSTAKLSISDDSIAAISIGNTSGRAYELISTSTGKFGILDREAIAYRFVIDDAGSVGIGMQPSRSTFDLTAKEQLKEWKTKAKKASWPIVTDGAFEQESTEDLVEQWIETRAAGDKLQVAGNISASGTVSASRLVSGDGSSNGAISGCIAYETGAFYAKRSAKGSGVVWRGYGAGDITSEISSAGNATFSGTVTANSVDAVRVYRPASGGCGMQFQTSSEIVPTKNDGQPDTTGAVSLGSATYKFKDAHFSGTVNANLLAVGNKRVYDTASGGIGIYMDGGTDAILPIDNAGNLKSAGPSLGNASRKFKGAYFSGTVDAAGFTINGVPISGGGLPDGDFTHNGKITATDFIATSDERLKENVTPMPVGLIDGIKPVSWDWKDGSGKSAGVVAQQLQAIGLDDYVVEGDDSQLGVNYQALTAILLAEVISLKAEVEALKS